MKLSSDVNTIFAYGNSNDLFHNKVWLFMAKNKRNDYVLLARVKHVFIYTYKDYLTTCCAIIEIAIREEKTKRSKSPSETYKPSTLALSANIHQQIEKFCNSFAGSFLVPDEYFWEVLEITRKEFDVANLENYLETL